MSSTGFVTFTNLQTVAMANASTLSHKVDTLDTVLAPEPRDIHWPNCHVTKPVRMARIQTASAGIMIGVLFWSLPVSIIQAMAKAEEMSKLPGLGWLAEAGKTDEEERTR
jgi:calcium permeable stress-gated cation channel